MDFITTFLPEKWKIELTSRFLDNNEMDINDRDKRSINRKIGWSGGMPPNKAIEKFINELKRSKKKVIIKTCKMCDCKKSSDSNGEYEIDLCSRHMNGINLLKELFSTDEYDICCHCIDEKKCSRCACLFMVGSQYCKKHDSCDFKTDERGLRCQNKCINCSKEDKEKNSVLTTNQNNDRINITKNFKIEHNQHNIDMYSKVMENFYFDYLKAPDQELYIENNYEISGVPKNCFRMMLKTIESNDTDVSATTSMP